MEREEWRRGEGYGCLGSSLKEDSGQCQSYLEESHVETHKWDSENSIKRDAGCFGTNKRTLAGQTHAHDEGLVASGNIRTVAFTLSWGMGARKWQARHKLTCSRQNKLNRHVTSTQCPSEPLFPISTVSGGNNELLCTNTTTSFQSQVFKQLRTNKVEKWSTLTHTVCKRGVMSSVRYAWSTFKDVLVFAVLQC